MENPTGPTMHMLLSGLGLHLLAVELDVRLKTDLWGRFYAQALLARGPHDAIAAAMSIIHATALELDAREEHLTYIERAMSSPEMLSMAVQVDPPDFPVWVLRSAQDLTCASVERLHRSLLDEADPGTVSPDRRTISLISARLGVEPPEYSMRRLG